MGMSRCKEPLATVNNFKPCPLSLTLCFGLPIGHISGGGGGETQHNNIDYVFTKIMMY